jgi:hypothetical protein
MKRLLAIVALLVPASAAADDVTPAARAKTSIDAQIATFRRGAAGEAAFLAMFEPDGVIVGDGGVMKASALAAALAQPYEPGDNESYEVHAMLARLFGASADGTVDKTLEKVTVGKVTAAGGTDAVWLTFDVTEKAFTTTTYRVSELLVDRGGWKLAVAHVAVPQPDSWEQEQESEGGGPTSWGAFPTTSSDLGPIAKLAASPKALAGALGKDVFVLGTTQKDVALGAAKAGKLLKAWARLRLAPELALEVHTPTWGYAVVQVLLPGKPGFSMKLRATVFAIPKAAGAWQAVAAHYSRVGW